jgi:hypothetical protein
MVSADDSSRGDLERLSIALLQNEMPLPKPVRLLGVSLPSLQATTKRNRNLASRFEGSVSSGFQETGGARFLGTRTER